MKDDSGNIPKNVAGFEYRNIIGERMRQQRKVSGKTLIEVGDIMDLTYQQVQKYEKGINQISAWRLAGLADHYQRPISFFIDPNPEVSDEEFLKILGLYQSAKAKGRTQLLAQLLKVCHLVEL